MNILSKIVKQKKVRVEEKKKSLPLEKVLKEMENLKGEGRQGSFSEAIKRKEEEPIKLIAEIKRASPTKGLLRNFDVLEMSHIYVKSGADALSVITEEDYFLGSPQYLLKIKNRYPEIPILRKDFIFDEYQVYETKMLGADALLLIAGILTLDEAKNLYRKATELGLEVLFEVHDEEDLEKAIESDASIIGINNRNLKTMNTEIENTLRLKELIPKDKIVVSESGISKGSQVEILLKAGVDAILVGTSIVLSLNPFEKIRELKRGLSKK